jgi:nicotinamidase-related amidase
MDPKTTAVVLIEYQNDFVSPGGTLHDAVKGVIGQHQYVGQYHRDGEAGA